MNYSTTYETSGTVGLVIFLLIHIISVLPFAIGNYFLARRLKKNAIVFALLSLIPIVNFIFLFFLGYMVVFRILDQLNALNEKND